MPAFDSATRTVRAAIATDREHGAVVPPLHLSTTFTFAGIGRSRRYDYTRSGNPTRDQFAHAVAGLEGGHGAVITSSGMSAVLLALQLAGRGDRVVAPHDAYGGTHRLLRSLAAKRHFDLTLTDLTADDAPERIRVLSPRLVWIETPSNPLLRITDIGAVAAAAHAAGALVVADNTFLSPVLQRPLELGADIVVHSATKYLNGHSDVVGGAVIAKDPAVQEELAWWANCMGLACSPFDAWLSLRGVRTLHARMAVHEANALEVVAALESHPAVACVYHPSLAAHPGHDRALRQQHGFGAIVSFELRYGLPAIRRFARAVRLFSLAESLGGVESLVAHPATMTHASMSPDARAAAGIPESLLRLSVGIESANDLVADIGRALDRCVPRKRGTARTAVGETAVSPA